ncbi:S-layer homology domain-containing protein [Cytobacillus firmus]|uniref:S-layer homology domain-containing protein n=1 Tax=Cytobacillus firmus TaxID=1399 RepID=UPI0038516B3D
MKRLISMLAICSILLIAGAGNVFAKGFPDVPEENRFYDEIMYLANEGIISGYPSGRFAPGEKVTRAAAAIMLGRVLGYDDTQRETVFPDVPKDSKASGYIQQAYENKIISGYPNGTFRPDNYVTRGEMAIFIARAYELTEEEVVPFSDVSINMSAFSAIRKIIDFGVTTGYPDGTFKPDLDLTREQFSGLLARAESDDFRLPVNICGFDADSRVNPDMQTMNCLLTKAAEESELLVPPEIVKAVASVENGGWKHFDANGEPIISDDGGIGLMQITNTAGYDVERLKYDLYYNIQTGIEFLAANFNRGDLPKINEHDPADLESWYFAIMAYNGTVPANSPFYQESGDVNTNAYQEKVYMHLNDFGDVTANIREIPMVSADFEYDRDSSDPIKFLKKSYEMDDSLLTPSTQLLNAGDKVTYEGSGLRSIPSTKGTLTPVTSNDVLSIIGEPVYDTQSASVNQFIWYPVQMSNGKKGYIASPYIVKK